MRMDRKAQRISAEAQAKRMGVTTRKQELHNANIELDVEDKRRRLDEEAAERKDKRAKRAKQDRADKRSKKIEAAYTWAADRWHLLLWLPIIVAPGALAWTAQQASGDAKFGEGLGWLLALFTEVGTWAAVAKAEIRKRRGEPVGAMHIVAWMIAAVSAIMNFDHGMSNGGFGTGLTFALVAVSGLAVHQVCHSKMDVIARFRQWLAARNDRKVRRGMTRVRRAAIKRQYKMERAVARSATGFVDAGGTVSLRYRTGPVTLSENGRKLVPGSPATVADEVAAMVLSRGVPGASSPLVLGGGAASGSTPISHQKHDLAVGGIKISSTLGSTPAADDLEDTAEMDLSGIDNDAVATLTDADRVVLDISQKLMDDGILTHPITMNKIYRLAMKGRGDRRRAGRVRDILNNGDLMEVVNL